MTKKLKFLLLAFLIPLIGFILYFSLKPNFSFKPVPEAPKTEIVQGQAAVFIDYGDGKKEATPFTPKAGQTAYDALQAIAQEKNIVLDTQQYDFGIFVKAIGGYESSAEMAWIYYINGTSGTIAADKQEVKAGDTIEWRFVKPQE